MLMSHYLKPVIIIAPDLQLGNLFLNNAVCLPCSQKGVKGALRQEGWLDTYRYVHGLNTGLCLY